MNIVTVLRSIKKFATELNLFETIETRSSLNHLRTAIIATRLYIILIAIALFILVLFNVLDQPTQTITILNPSEDSFQEHYSKRGVTDPGFWRSPRSPGSPRRVYVNSPSPSVKRCMCVFIRPHPQ
jgi:hypothetical protein